jgi:hypothetical protein
VNIQLRLKALASAPMPNLVEVVELDPAYKFSPLVDIIDAAIAKRRLLKLRTLEGDALVIRTDVLHSLAIRETH